jgi:hypothetical protein
MRFENINKDPPISTRTRHPSVVQMSKLSKRDTSFSLIRKDIGHNFYEPVDKLTRQRQQIGMVELARLSPRKSQPEIGPVCYDPLKAHNQFLQSKRNSGSLVSFEKQTKRDFLIYQAALQSEKMEQMRANHAAN